MSVRVVAPGRLHFGLLHVPASHEADCWPDSRVPVRWYGGAGMMVESPGVELRVEPATEWSAGGPSSGRALAAAREIAQRLLGENAPSLRVRVETCPPEHVGLGVGTQLHLAVAAAVRQQFVAAGLIPDSAPSGAELILLTGRGQRSRVGVSGFFGGGFVIEGGSRPRTSPGASAVFQRVAFPADWRVVLACPRAATRWHGDAEARVFRRTRPTSDVTRATDRMARLLLLGVWPALAERDYPAFGEALHEYNREAGAAFAADQGGVYSDPAVERLVGAIRAWGVPGSGQSSWGPTTFAVTPDPDRAEALANHLRGLLPDAEFVCVAAGNNTGATVSTD